MSFLRWAFPSFFVAGRWWRRRLTPGGKNYSVVLALCLALLFQSESAGGGLFAVLAALAAIAVVGNYLFRPRLEAQVAAPRSVACGDELMAIVRVTNHNWLAAYDLELQLLPDAEFWGPAKCLFRPTAIPPSGAADLAVSLRPIRRGVFPWPRLEATSTFPLHLLRSRAVVGLRGEIIVHPYRPQAALALLEELVTRLTGQLTASLARGGDSSEFLGNREFLPGVLVRRWDYRSWARLNKPIVREFEECLPRSVALVVDTCGPAISPAGAVDDRFEAVLSAAAAVVDACGRQDLTLQHLVVGKHAAAQHSSGAWDEAAALEVLARAQLVPEASFGELIAAARWLTTAGQVVVVLSRWDSQRRELCQAFREAGVDWHGVLIVGADEVPAEELPEELIAIDWPRPDSPWGDSP